MWKNVARCVGRLPPVAIGFLASIVLSGVHGPASAGDYGFAGMSTTDTLVVFDLATGTALAPAINLLPEGNYPYDVTIHPRGHELWVVGAIGDGVVVIDTETHDVIARVAMGTNGEYPVDVVFGRDGDLAYVSARDSDPEAVVVIDVATHTMTGTVIPISSNYLGSGKMTVNPVTGEIYLVDWYSNQLFAIDPATLAVTSEEVGNALWDLSIDSSGTTLYIADRGTDQIHVVDTSDLSVVTSVAVGDDPWGLDLTPDGRYLFVANEDSHDVSVIDTSTNTLADTIPLASDADPRDVDISADGLAAYVPSGSVAGDDSVFVIDTSLFAVVDTISMAPSSNTNAVAVAPEFGVGIFADGFESGDTGAWSTVVP